MPKKRSDTSEPKFPYSTEPKALRRLLTEIPKRPKPTNVTLETLKSWSVSKNSNSRTAIAVLKKLGLLGASGEPAESYVDFMKTGTGPGALATRIKEVYAVLFENSHAPQDEPNDELRKLFNIHSGGGEQAMRLQIQTFKALAEHANFEAGTGSAAGDRSLTTAKGGQPEGGSGNGQHLPPIRVDLHIHLPENKTSRDYEAIIQDIARYIYGRDIERV